MGIEDKVNLFDRDKETNFNTSISQRQKTNTRKRELKDFYYINFITNYVQSNISFSAFHIFSLKNVEGEYISTNPCMPLIKIID